jgi:hypothetical protein
LDHHYLVDGSRSLSDGDPAVLWTVWAKESGQWKIVSYVLLSS